MSFFTFDEKEAKSFDLVPVGEYETFVSEFKPHKFNTGSEGFKMTLTIRSDVEQEAAGQKMWDNLVMSASAAFKFHQLFKALGLENGISFATPEAMIEVVLNQALRIKVVHETKPEFNNGEPQARIKTYLMSNFGGTGTGGSKPSAFDLGNIDVDMDDMPF